MNGKAKSGALLGAAFLMATSAIGPGFLTQTAKFTGDFQESFGFVILISVILSAIAQLNIWRVLCVSGMRGQDVGNRLLPGLGYFISFLIVLGGLVFNIGNVGGGALGIQTTLGIPVQISYFIAGGLAVLVFLSKDAKGIMDKLVKILGGIMIVVILVVIFIVKPPVATAVKNSFVPDAKLGTLVPAILTLLGGTVGGYITFAGAHRLIDAGVTGEGKLKDIQYSAVMGMIVAAIVRILLFLAVLGVVAKGIPLNPKNPAETPFEYVAGHFGQILFGVVIWAASITSVIGAAYTSVSFLTSLCPTIERNRNCWIIGFIVVSTAVLVTVGKPAAVLVFVGTLNGLILPIALALILLAAYRSNIVGSYKHPICLAFAGWFVVIIMAILSGKTIISYVSSFVS